MTSFEQDTRSPESETQKRCGQCHALLKPGQDSCWLCGEPASSAEPVSIDEPAGSPFAAQHRAAFQFSLSSILLTMTLTAVLLARMSAGVWRSRSRTRAPSVA